MGAGGGNAGASTDASTVGTLDLGVLSPLQFTATATISPPQRAERFMTVPGMENRGDSKRPQQAARTGQAARYSIRT